MAVSARTGLSVVFAVHGGVTGTFATRVPWLADHVGVDTGQLGIALLFPAVGAMLAMSFAGRLVHRYNPRTVTRVLLACWCLALVLPALAPNLPVLCAVLLAYGATAGMADVAMNAEGVAVEAQLGRPVMSGLHAMWSFGGLAAAGIGILFAASNVDGLIHFAVMAVVLLAVGGWAGRYLPTTRPPADAEEPPAFALPSKPVLLIGIAGFCSVFGEAAGSDWAAKYLTDVAVAPAGVAAAAYTGFAAAMAVTRLAGNTAVARLGMVNTVRLSGAIATAGALLIAVAREPVPAIVGFALLGVGVATIVPLAFAAAGATSAHPGHEIAGVATIAYGAGLAAPGIIGAIAHSTSLPVSFLAVAALCAVVAVSATAFRPARRPR